MCCVFAAPFNNYFRLTTHLNIHPSVLTLITWPDHGKLDCFLNFRSLLFSTSISSAIFTFSFLSSNDFLSSPLQSSLLTPSPLLFLSTLCYFLCFLDLCPSTVSFIPKETLFQPPIPFKLKWTHLHFLLPSHLSLLHYSVKSYQGDLGSEDQQITHIGILKTVQWLLWITAWKGTIRKKI